MQRFTLVKLKKFISINTFELTSKANITGDIKIKYLLYR